MKLMLFYLSILCMLFAIGCENTSKQKTAENERGIPLPS